MEYIGRETLRKILKDWRDAHADADDEQGCGLLEDVIWEVDAQPAADVAPVVHGEWIYKRRYRGGVNVYEGVDEFGEKRRVWIDMRREIDEPYCSVCRKLNDGSSLDYCPNCGARMDGGIADG